jgi:hypothetical protein
VKFKSNNKVAAELCLLPKTRRVTIKKTPSQTAGIRYLLGKTTVHWGERSQQKKPNILFLESASKKLNAFRPFWQIVSAFHARAAQLELELELVGANALYN